MASWWWVTIVEKRGSKNLFALKFGRAPFEKSANSLAAILGEIAAELFLNFVVESAREFLLASGKKLFLHRANGQVRTLRNFLRQLFHLRFKLRGRNDVIDNPERVRGFRVDHVSGGEKLGRFGGADHLWQQIRSTEIRKQADFGKVLAKRRLFGCDTYVRSERDVHARAGRGTVYRSNYGLRHGAHLQDHLHARAQQGLQFLGRSGLAALAQQREIPSRAEGAARPGDYHHANLGVRRNSAKRFIYRYAKLVIERVHPVGAVHHQGGAAVMLGLEEDGRRWSCLGRLAHEYSCLNVFARSALFRCARSVAQAFENAGVSRSCPGRSPRWWRAERRLERHRAILSVCRICTCAGRTVRT